LVMMYLVCIFMVFLPIMCAETLISCRGRQSPVNSLKALAIEAGASPKWSWAALIGMIAALLILSFYSVITGWPPDDTLSMGGSQFSGVTAEGAGAAFGALTADPWRLTLWHTLFMLLTGVVIARGVVTGLKRCLRVMVPLLWVLLMVLLGYSMTTGHFVQGLHLLFDFSARSATRWVLAAMGHAFFTLSVGVGAIMVCGSYMPMRASMGGTILTVGILGTLVALAAGMALFPIVFATGLELGAGPGLMVVSLPVAFGNIAFGQSTGTLFLCWR
jgi:NSS family neurotransmitter:Na+ symporter